MREADATAQARIELERVVRRWRTLPLDHALAASPAMREVVEALARDLVGRPARVPDLGPAVLADQLRVVVHDALDGRPSGPASDAPPGPAEVAALLTGLRHRIG